jgi:hypothetical protein
MQRRQEAKFFNNLTIQQFIRTTNDSRYNTQRYKDRRLEIIISAKSFF